MIDRIAAIPLAEDLTFLDPPDLRGLALTWSVCLLAGTLALLLALHLRRKGREYWRRFDDWRHRPRRAKNPQQRALHALRKLEKSGASRDSNDRAREVDAILRVYLEERFGLHATRQTAEDTIRESSTAQVPDAPLRERLHELLVAAESGKFSRRKSPDATQALLERLREFINQTPGPGTFPPDYAEAARAALRTTPE